MKLQETSVNKCHEHILLIIIIIYLLLIYIYFLYTDIHSLMMLWKTFEETADMSALCSHLG